MDDNYLTVNEVADRFRVSRPTVYAWLKEGKIESTKLGKVRRILASSVNRFVEEGKHLPIADDEQAQL